MVKLTLSREEIANLKKHLNLTHTQVREAIENAENYILSHIWSQFENDY